MSQSGFWQISLRLLLIAVPVIAMGCAAVVNPTKGWSLTIAVVALAILLLATLSAVFERDRRQAFAIGFLLCGLLHLTALQALDQMPTRMLLEEVYFAHHGGAAPTQVDSIGMLARGDSGPLVEALQTALNAEASAGTNLEIDGDFGGRTASAVRALQKRHGHPVDGVVGVTTWRVLGPAGRRALEMYGFSDLPLTTIESERFVAIGAWLVTLSIAFVGGAIASAAYARRKRTAS